MRTETVKTGVTSAFTNGPWYGFRVLAVGAGTAAGGDTLSGYAQLSTIRLDDSPLALTLSSGFGFTPPNGHGGRPPRWKKIEVVNNSDGDLLIALAEVPGELLPEPSFAWSPKLHTKGALRVVIEDPANATILGFASQGRPRVVPEGSQTLPFLQSSDGLLAIGGLGDGTGGVTGYLSLASRGGLYTENMPRSEAALLETGAISNASGNGSAYDVTLYNGLLVVAQLVMGAGTVQIGIDAMHPTVAGAVLAPFLNQTAQATGTFVSVQLLSLSSSAQVNHTALHASVGYRAQSARAKWVCAGVASSTGTYRLYGIR